MIRMTGPHDAVPRLFPVSSVHSRTAAYNSCQTRPRRVYQPVSPGRRAWLDRCVYHTLQLRRCARAQAEAVADQVRSAEVGFDARQEEEVERLQRLLPDDPAAARELRR